MKKLRSLSLATLCLFALHTPCVQATSLFTKVAALTTLCMLATQHAHSAPEKLHAIDVVEPPAYVTNLKYFEWPFPKAKYFAGGHNVTLSMTQLGGEALPFWLTFTQEERGVYTLKGAPGYDGLIDYDKKNGRYVLVAQDSSGAEVKLPFVLHIEGLSPIWLSIVMVQMTGLIASFSFLALMMMLASRRKLRKQMLEGRYKEVEESLARKTPLVRICCCFKGSEYKELKESVTLREQEAVAMIVCQQETPKRIKKKTAVPVNRITEWYKLLFSPSVESLRESRNFDAILEYLRAKEGEQLHTTSGQISA